jgi:hypothetical protein
LSFTADTGIQAGFGPSSNFAGNLVPFSAGLAYEENPTISYAPVGGDLYARRLLSPIPLELLVGFLRSRAVLAGNFAVVVKRINGISNPDFLSSPTAAPDPRFSRLVALFDSLHRAGVLSFAAIAEKSQEFAIVMRDYVPGHAQEVEELLRLLDLPAVSGARPIVVPMSAAVERDQTNSVAVTTRSLAALMEIMTAAVEVSEEQARSGRVVDYPPPGLIGRQVRIQRSESAPDDASVRVKYRDAWYYIADTDLRTKEFFRFIELLWGITVASSTASQPAPVLTVPVGR